MIPYTVHDDHTMTREGLRATPPYNISQSLPCQDSYDKHRCTTDCGERVQTAALTMPADFSPSLFVIDAQAQ